MSSPAQQIHHQWSRRAQIQTNDPKKLQIKAKESAGDESGLEEELRWAVDGFPRMQLSRPSAARLLAVRGRLQRYRDCPLAWDDSNTCFHTMSRLLGGEVQAGAEGWKPETLARWWRA